MPRLSWISVVLTCVCGVPSTRFHEDDSSENAVVDLGSDVHLFVSVARNGVMESKNFKECMWIHDSSREMCTFTYTNKGALGGSGDGKWSVKTDCTAGLKGSATFFGSPDLNKENTLCGMKLSGVRLENGGAWTCSVQECKLGKCGNQNGNGEYVEHKARLEILKIASGMTLDPVSVQTGSTFPIVCRVADVNPKPSLSWKLDGKHFEGETVEMVDDNGDGTVTVSQELMLLGDPELDGSVLECRAEVKNISQAMETVWEERVQQQIHVEDYTGPPTTVKPTTGPPTTAPPTTAPPTTDPPITDPPTTDPPTTDPPTTDPLTTDPPTDSPTDAPAKNY